MNRSPTVRVSKACFAPEKRSRRRVPRHCRRKILPSLPCLVPRTTCSASNTARRCRNFLLRSVLFQSEERETDMTAQRLRGISARRRRCGRHCLRLPARNLQIPSQIRVSFPLAVTSPASGNRNFFISLILTGFHRKKERIRTYPPRYSLTFRPIAILSLRKLLRLPSLRTICSRF